jgi:hypothetical protein
MFNLLISLAVFTFLFFAYLIGGALLFTSKSAKEPDYCIVFIGDKYYPKYYNRFNIALFLHQDAKFECAFNKGYKTEEEAHTAGELFINEIKKSNVIISSKTTKLKNNITTF